MLNKRAHLLLDSYNHLRGPVATPLNVSAVLAGKGDAGALACWGGTARVFGGWSPPREQARVRRAQELSVSLRRLHHAEADGKELAPAAEEGEAARSQILIGHLASYEVRLRGRVLAPGAAARALVMCV